MKPSNHSKTILVITGPTASGKTALAIRLAQHYRTAVISADSRQCYREMTIGTAKPSTAELQGIPHYFIDSHSVGKPVNAAEFETLALGYADEIFRTRDLAILSGGTGLYVRAFTQGLDIMPPIPEAVRKRVRRLYHTGGLEALREAVRREDPAFFEAADNRNPHRLMRALEVREASGQSILAYRHGKPKARNFHTVKIGLNWPRELLGRRIAERTRDMLEAGLVEEVKGLSAFRQSEALQTVGYREIFSFLDGAISLDAATEQIITHTRQYAKRQMTWFSRDKETAWLDARDPEQLFREVLSQTAKFAQNTV